MTQVGLSYRWNLRIVDDKKVDQLVVGMNLHRILARVLVARGIDSIDAAEHYLRPDLNGLGDPFGFADMDLACDRLLKAMLSNEVIGIFGDYDVDGVTSTVLLWEFLESCGAQVVATIPDRLREGYGLNVAGLDRLQTAGATLVVTVDCGITAHKEVEEAVTREIDVIVIDHHTVLVDLPKAVAVINPHRPDCERAATHMCAVGVVFNLCMVLRKRLREINFFGDKPEPNLKDLLDLVALGTVADVVPLILENRIFVHYGLALIRQEKRIGFKALLDVAEVRESKVTASTLGFHLGPRINAAGRLEDAMQAVKLLRTKEIKSAIAMAQTLNTQNQSRRELEKEILDEAILEINQLKIHQDALVLVIGRENWHPGVVGIVASRLVEKFGKPTIVIGENGKGSGRSISAFHLHQSLCQVQDCLQGFGGHAHAVGVHLVFSKLNEFRYALNQYAARVLKPEDLIQNIAYDGKIVIEDISENLINDLAFAAPFGRGNPEPVFRFSRLNFKNLRELKGGHVRGDIIAKKNITFIAFGMVDKIKLFEKPADVLAYLEINEWKGRKTMQLRIKDIREEHF
jgi:single-stranded-DNA-specific exonuclease